MGTSISVAALEVRVTAYAGEPVSVPMVCRLEGPAGLTIGRSPGNDLVLDDPARQVSRFQAKVTANPTGAELSNVSSQSCVLINGAEIKPGETTKLQVGDHIVMGRFLLELGSSDAACEQAAPGVSARPAIEAEPVHQPDSIPVESNLQIPDDYDVFAVPEHEDNPTEQQVNSLSDFSDSQSRALLEELEAAPVVGPQSLFEEKPSAAGALLKLVDEKRDPMQLFGAPSSELMPETLALDHASEMERFITLPAYEKIEPQREPEKDSNLSPNAFSPATDSADVSVSTTAQTATQLQEPVPTDRGAATAASSSHTSIQNDVASQEGDQSGSTLSLMSALAKGSGLPLEALPELTPELMLELGSILRAMSDGTVKLMHSRSMTKHEMRANVTIIASAGNNPIKFAPDGTAALQQMLGKRFSGFMQPIAAIEDAFDDLSAHQLGLLAGARRAAIELIERLNPGQTMEEYEPSGVLEGLLPLVKEAKLWRKHKRRYQKIADDQEGLASLIEQSFVRSYEEEIERIYAGRGQ